jgi:UPF0755 protein
MPESPSPFDDPFADLFGKLPDPRSQRAAGDGARGGQTAPPASRPAPTPPQRPAEKQTDAAAAPLSRREARAAAEAAARPSAVEHAEKSPRVPPANDPSADAGTIPNAASTSEESVAAARPATPRPQASAAPTARLPQASARLSARATGRPDPHARASAGLEGLFAGETTTDDLGAPPPPPNKRKRRIGGWIALGVVLVILGGLTAGGFYVWNTYEDKIRAFMGWEEPKDYEPGQATGEATVTIASGDTGSPISQHLFEAGITKTPTVFYDYLISSGQNPTFQPGQYRMQQKMTAEAALAALLNPDNKVQNGAVLPEGLTVGQSLQRLSDGTGIPLADFEAAVADPTQYGVTVDPAIAAAGGQPLEGWLFPATYEFDPGTTATQIIQRLVDRTIESLDKAQVPVSDRQRILTVASIIQREGHTADFPKVSRVIQNRLDQGMQLQMDSTAQYGFGELHAGSASTSDDAQYNDNPWNTYVISGLPIGPIANPGDLAIDAAMHPADGDWLYFVTVNLDTGETVFSNNVDAHDNAVAQWRQWCSDHPDSGC